MLAARQFDVWENARLFALVNLAMAEGYIAGFEANTITTTGVRSPLSGKAATKNG